VATDEKLQSDTPLDQEGASPLSADENAKLTNIEDRLSTPSSPGSVNSTANRLQNFRAFTSRHRRKLIGGGLGGGTVVLLLTSFFPFLAPFRLDFYRKNIEQVRLARLYYFGDERTDRFLVSMMMAEIGGNIEGDTSRNRYFIAKGWDTTHPFATWYRDLKTTKFFDDLADKQGIRFVRQLGPDGIDRLVKVDIRGLPSLEFDEKGTLNTANVPDFENRVIQVFERNREGRRAFNLAVKQNTHRVRLLHRRHIRAWGRDTLGITKWRFYENKREDARNRMRSLWTRRVELRAQGGSFLRCLLKTSTCPDTASLNDNDNKTRPPAAGTPESTDIDEAENRLRAGESPELPAGESSRFARLMASQTVQRIMKTLNIIGIIDMLSTIDDLLGKGQLLKLVSVAKAARYATAYMTFTTMTDHLKEGEGVAGEEVDAVMQMFDYAERSDSYHQVFTPATVATRRNQAVAAEEPPHAQVTDDMTVASDGSAAAKLTRAYQRSFGVVIGPINKAYDRTGLKWLVGKVGDLVGFALQPFVDAAKFGIRSITGLDIDKAAQSVGEDALVRLGGASNCSGEESGGQLLNCIDGGAAVTQEAFIQHMGGSAATDEQIKAIDQQIGLNQSDERSRFSLWNQIASRERSDSLFARAVMVTPVTWNELAAAANYVAARLTGPRMFLAVGHSLLSISSQTASANHLPENLYAVKRYTIPDLHKEPYGGKNQAQCDEEIKQFKAALQAGEATADKASSLCLTDTIIANTIISYYTDKDDGGLGAESRSGVATGAVPSGDVQALAKQMLANPNITYWTNNGVNTRDVVVALSEGKPARTTCENASNSTAQINPNILKFLVDAGNKTPLQVNALTDKCHTANSRHYAGQAVDLENNSNDDTIILTARQYGGTKNNERTHMHFDF
jgi:hypothetical protein